MSTHGKYATYLCGTVQPHSEAELARGVVLLKGNNSVRFFVSPDDPGLVKVVAGRRRLVVVECVDLKCEILAVYGRPRIRLIRLLERGCHVTEEVLECYLPMYLRRYHG